MTMLRKMILCAALVSGSTMASGSVVLDEGFDNVSGLFGSVGWLQVNSSSPVGETGWFQGDNTEAFAASSGAANSYVAANFNNAGFGGDVDNWLITPELSLLSHTEFYFDTRTAGNFPGDSLELLYNNTGSTNIADFVSIGWVPAAYPTDWTTFYGVLDGPLQNARFAFHYHVTDTSVNGDYIGIDSVHVTSVPEPGTLALLGAGLLLVPMMRRRRAAH